MQNTLHTLLFDNHYDPLSTSTTSPTPYDTLPPVIQNALLNRQRIILIANNPSISQAKLEALLQPTDMLVLFNDFIHAEFFARHELTKTLPKLLFFRQIGDSLLHFGLPPRSNNVAVINEMATQAPLGILLSNTTYQFPTPADDPRPNDDPVTESRIVAIPKILHDLLQSDEQCRVLSERHDVVADYPSFTHIHSSAPTSGFLLYRLLLAARLEVRELQPKRALLEIVMLGFNDSDKTAHFWEGHNWTFERQELATPPNGVDMVRQY